MKTILWYQPEKFGVPDVICQDGEIISGFQREEAIDLLKAASDVCIKHDLPWCGHVRLSKNNRKKVFFVKGTFKGVDECGRTLSFMFLSGRADDYLKTLNKELQVVHQELSEGTIKCIKKKKKSSFNERLIFILFVLLITIIISIFL